MFKPMLAGKFDPETQRYPCYVAPKIDGIRCLIMNGLAMSRSMKPLPNQFLQAYFADGSHDGLDGELVVGDDNHPDIRRMTTSAIMAEKKCPAFTFTAFDRWDMAPTSPFSTRLACINTGKFKPRTKRLQHQLVDSPQLLDMLEEEFLSAGYEGAMVRAPEGRYKWGRSTTKEGGLLKLKRFMDAEARIVGWNERMHNGNEPFTNELGRTKRTSHQENKVGLNMLGSWIVKGIGPFEGQTFDVPGFTAEDATDFWARREDLKGQVITYRYFNHGVKDKPILLSFAGFRELGT